MKLAKASPSYVTDGETPRETSFFNIPPVAASAEPAPDSMQSAATMIAGMSTLRLRCRRSPIRLSLRGQIYPQGPQRETRLRVHLNEYLRLPLLSHR